jgi:hypothetical protein
MANKNLAIDMNDVIDLFKTLQNDAINNGVNMFNANEPNVNSNNMISHFYQFIKKYIVIVKNKDEIINI